MVTPTAIAARQNQFIAALYRRTGECRYLLFKEPGYVSAAGAGGLAMVPRGRLWPTAFGLASCFT